MAIDNPQGIVPYHLLPPEEEGHMDCKHSQKRMKGAFVPHVERGPGVNACLLWNLRYAQPVHHVCTACAPKNHTRRG